MKRYEAIFKKFVYAFKASDPIVANEMAKAFRNKKYPKQHFKLIQIGL